MLKFLLTIVILIHSLIHLLGFVREWNLAQVKGLTGKTLIPFTGYWPKIFGTLWLLGFLLFLISAVGLVLSKQWWIYIAGLGVILSQVLVVLYWKDAWAGTIPNLIILISLILVFAYWNVRQSVDNDAQSLFAQSLQGESIIVTEKMLEKLPEPVKRYLTYTGVVGKPIVRTVRLKQVGKIRQSPKQKWMDITADEYYSTTQPTFIWRAEMKTAALPAVQVRDFYKDGKGGIVVKMLSMITIANPQGKEMDEASMMRYLNEMMWFPCAFLKDNITWKAIDDHSAEVTFTDKGKSATAIMFFDGEGRLKDFVAKRYNTDTKQCEIWSTPIAGYGEFEGLRLPIQGKAVWKLKEGDFAYIDVTITDLEYDVSKPY